jgi:hypothetical protein
MARRDPLVMIQCTCLIRYLVQFAYLLLMGEKRSGCPAACGGGE